MLGRFVMPASRFAELAGLPRAAVEPLPVSAILDGAHVARDLAHLLEATGGSAPAATVESIELRLPDRPDGDVRSSIIRIVADIDASGLPRSTSVYLEIGFGEGWRAHLTATFDALADARVRSLHPIAAKIRCGGVTADAVPTIEQVAFAVGTLRALAVPFKATAGLHHPLRHHDAAGGFVVHGFLNVIGVAILDHELDLDERTRQRVVMEEEPAAFSLDDDAFGWRELRVAGTQVAEARRDFVHSYGSCSFTEPVQDLRSLGILT